VLGGTGYQLVSSGDSPDGMGGDVASPNASGFQLARLNHSGWRVANRSGRVARATLVKKTNLGKCFSPRPLWYQNAEGVPEGSRGLSESASDTPGSRRKGDCTPDGVLESSEM
jgi:hypothetical protein